MKKLVIFNVGGALSCYAEFNDKKIVIDLGTGVGFSPTKDFLYPLTNRKPFAYGFDDLNRQKFVINQLFLSHLDRDHIADYVNFRKDFYGFFMTCPNDNGQQQNVFKINRNLLGVESECRNFVLEDMARRTTKIQYNPVMSPENPLVSIVDEISLFYINPGVCESYENLRTGYSNNLSLVLFIKVGNKTVLLPGDILKEGMKYLIDNEPEFKSLLELEGVDYLVAPHHGLQTSFSEYLFQTMKGNRTRLNIISEKVRVATSNENRTEVDSRYYSSDYSTGENSLVKKAVKTSLGHIVIDFDEQETEIRQYADNVDVVNEFL
ncbi:MAG: hypothetical protein ABJJ25_15270 [Eudoraea sp.]|uniref:hypothetical protein n=1 Tax=Eudoraea sp. TaxID=1979955 RepID=UPI00326660A4